MDGEFCASYSHLLHFQVQYKVSERLLLCLVQGRIAATEAQQLALLGNAAALAEELLPRAANKLVPEAIVGDSQAKGGRGQTGTLSGRTQELREWKRRLQKGVENLRLSIGNAMVVDLCYDDGDEGSKLNAITYLSIDHEMPMWHTNPMPTPIFQVCLRFLSTSFYFPVV